MGIRKVDKSRNDPFLEETGWQGSVRETGWVQQGGDTISSCDMKEI